MNYIIAELTDEYDVVSIESVTDYEKMLIYIENYSVDDGGLYMCDDHIEHHRIIFNKNGTLHWTDRNLLKKFILVNMDFKFVSIRDFIASTNESIDFKVSEQIKPLLRDLRINEILSVPL